MKNLVAISLLFITIIGYSQEKMDAIFSALGTGDVEILAEYLHPRAEVHLLDRVSVYDKPKSIAALKRFYNQNTPSEYKKIHRGASRARNSLYSIGKLSTSNGDFRVYLYVKRVNEKVFIQEIRFDRD